MRRYLTLYSILSLLIGLCFFSHPVSAQAPPTLSSGEILLKLEKLQVLGSVLYVAAHPDDENTAMLTYLSNDRLVRTAYLSLTRGDGGQNLIGPEQRELMGLIRTQELLQARRIDGGEQFFSRANDFGYSKHARETFQIWDRDLVLSDVVQIIRKYRPDVIITRFPPTRNAGHGHHEASALLAIEAFSAAADPTKFPEQLDSYPVWQAKRLLWNCYSRRRGVFSNLPPDSAQTYPVEIGTYNTLLGKSHMVIAAMSRSMHRSQGFGATRSRTERTDYVMHMAGEKAEDDLLDNINLTWSRLPESSNISNPLKEALEKYSSRAPQKILPELLKAYAAMQAHPKKDADSRYWITYKQNELKSLIKACSAFWLDADAATSVISPGDSLGITLELMSRLSDDIEVKSLKIVDVYGEEVYTHSGMPMNLEKGKMFNPKIGIKVPSTISNSQPYWLIDRPGKGLFQINNPELVGYPENEAPLMVQAEVQMFGQSLTFKQKVQYKWTQPDKGELYRDLTIVPPVLISQNLNSVLFAGNDAKTVNLKVQAGKAQVSGTFKLELPEGWKAEPAEYRFQLSEKDETQNVKVKLTPPSFVSDAYLKVLVKLDQETAFHPTNGIKVIEYPHIPTQTVFPPTEIRLVKLDLKTAGKNIGYIPGAGDAIPESLMQFDYQVTELNQTSLEQDLSDFDAIVVGIRAYNTQSWLKFAQKNLLEYVKNGGNLVVQYQTNRRLVLDEIGPYPMKLSRDRVTVEEAPMKFLKPKHPVLNQPNKITQKDFDGWVQERGLYFANKWDDRYQTILSSQDPGEKELSGGLLYTKYGQGTFIYTGLSFFRELPAGVSGAYRLFINLISQ